MSCCFFFPFIFFSFLLFFAKGMLALYTALLIHDILISVEGEHEKHMEVHGNVVCTLYTHTDILHVCKHDYGYSIAELTALFESLTMSIFL